MGSLNRLFIIFLTIAATLVIVIYIVWIPSPQEKPYTLVKTWGEPGQSQGQFNEPTGIAIHGHEVYVSDSRNMRIQVFDLEGNLQRVFGDTGDSSEKLARPMNLTIANNQLYVADFFDDQIKVYGLNGQFVRSIGDPGADPGQISAPGGVAVAENGDVFVADFYNQRVQHLRGDGSFVRQWGVTKAIGVFNSKMNYPTDVALARDGKLFVADGYNDRVLAFGRDGELLGKWGGPFAINIFGPFNGWFATVTGITVGPSGDVFVADFYNDRVQKFTQEGVFLNAFGINSTGPTHTAFAAVEADDGSVYVTDYANHQVQVWQPAQ